MSNTEPRRLASVSSRAVELDARSTPGALWAPLEGAAVRCSACAHRCVIAPGGRGACGVRYNLDGVLRVPSGYVARRYVRAVETNTIYHLCSGSTALTFGMFGCDLRCPYCHNHAVSQALRDGANAARPIDISAEALVEEAVDAGCAAICAAYNEPLISAEWVRIVFQRARERGLRTALVSDGHSTPEALSFMRDVTDVFRVDLKAATESAYRELGGRLGPVLDSIRHARGLGYWIEVVTLLVPGLNHDLESVRTLAARISEIDLDIPWHLNAFVPRYRWSDRPPADPLLLTLAAGIAYSAGLRFVYVGNVPGFAELSHTRCPNCRAVVVRRANYRALEVRLDAGRCPECRAPIAGSW